MKGTEHKNDQTINDHTRTALGVLVAVVAVLGAGLVEWCAERAQINELQKSQWTVTEQLQWTSQFQQDNQSLHVPMPQVPTGLAAIMPSTLMAEFEKTNIAFIH